MLRGFGNPADRLDDMIILLVLVGLATVGVVVASRVPGNRIGWIFLAGALLVSGFGVADLYADFAHEIGLPGAVTAAWLVQVFWAPAFILLFPLLFLLFPNGRPPTPRWRWVAWAALASSTVLVPLGGFVPGRLEALPEVVNPVGLDALDLDSGFLGPALAGLGFALLLSSLIGSLAAMVARFRRSSGVERQQLKWFVFAAACTGVGFAIFMVISVTESMGSGLLRGVSETALVLSWLGGLALPVAAGLAILRYRLYDIDLVINKTVVFALLAGFIGLTYSLVVVGLGRLIGGAEGLALPIAATAVIAVAFEPVRHLAHRWANRVVYGRRATPYEVLSDLTERLAQAEAGEGILARMATLLSDGTGADRVTVWLGSSGEMEPSVTSPPENAPIGDLDLRADNVFPVYHEEEIVGALEVAKPDGSVLSSMQRSLVSDLAGSAGLILGYQRLNDTLAERAREVEKSRQRLLGAQDQERQRLERALNDGVEQLIVSLRLRIELASRLAASHRATDLENLLSTLGEETERALAEVRLLAKGIYPPVLVSDGLAAALSGLAASVPVDVVINNGTIGRYPAELEAAVYFDVSEAVTNAVKYGGPPIRIDLVEKDGMLSFSVHDAGKGFDVAVADGGSGLENMSDRLDAVGGRLLISTSPGEGTTVRGEIPLNPDSSDYWAAAQTRVKRPGSNSDLETKATAPASRARDSYSS
jgi:signal transduction histidine kinase